MASKSLTSVPTLRARTFLLFVVFLPRASTECLYTPDVTGQVVVPAGTSTIGEKAFKDCDALTSIVFPNSLTSISDFAFIRTSLEELRLPASLQSIGDFAFAQVESLTSVTFAEGLEEIGERSFSGCVSLESIALPSSLSSMGVGAFYACESVVSLFIADGIESIAISAFSGCASLSEVIFPLTLAVIENEVMVRLEHLPPHIPQLARSLDLPACRPYQVWVSPVAGFLRVRVARNTYPPTLSSIHWRLQLLCVHVAHLACPAARSRRDRSCRILGVLFPFIGTRAT